MAEKREILKADEAAALLRVTPQTIRGLAHDGRIPVARVGQRGGAFRFYRQDLLDWARAGGVQSATSAGLSAAPAGRRGPF